MLCICDVDAFPQIQLSESRSEVDELTKELTKERKATETAKVNYLMKLIL